MRCTALTLTVAMARAGGAWGSCDLPDLDQTLKWQPNGGGGGGDCKAGGTLEDSDSCRVDCAEGFEGEHVDYSCAATALPKCVACAVGKYKSYSREACPEECTACPKYSTTEKEGSTQRLQCGCLSGYNGTAATGVCVACSAGQYNGEDVPATLGHVAKCQSCPGELTTATEGATSSDKCGCPTGSEGPPVNGTCRPCALHQYADSVGSTACSHCPLDSITNHNGSVAATECICKPPDIENASVDGRLCSCPAQDTVESNCTAGGLESGAWCWAHCSSEARDDWTTGKGFTGPSGQGMKPAGPRLHGLTRCEEGVLVSRARCSYEQPTLEGGIHKQSPLGWVLLAMLISMVVCAGAGFLRSQCKKPEDPQLQSYHGIDTIRGYVEAASAREEQRTTSEW